MKNTKALTLLLMLIILFIINDSCFAQTQNDYVDRWDVRTISLQGNIGFPEIYSLGLGVQLTRNIKVSLMLGNIYHPVLGTWLYPGFICLRANYYFNNKIWLVNNIGLTYGQAGINNDEAKLYDLSIGYESIRKTSISYYYSFGINVMLPKKNSNQILPNIKVGININL